MASKKCCVPTCKRPRSPNTTLYSFPKPEKYPDRFRKWIYCIGGDILGKSNDYIFNHRHVCQHHFEQKYITSGKKLTNIAELTLLLPTVQSRDPCDTPDNAADKDTRAEDTRTGDTNANDDQGDDLGNDCDDDVPSPVVPELPRELFSWEKTDAIIADEVVSSVIVQEDPEMTLDLGDVSMYNDEQTTKDYSGEEHTEYRCNECEKTINGFRYMCVQCVDFDLCASCEARGAHARHYALRVPGDRPYKEIQAVLAAIRHQMLSENLFLPEIIASVKEELEDEQNIPEGAPEPALEPDPLGATDVSFGDDDCDILENFPEHNEHEDNNENDESDDRPPRKRRRTSLDPLDNEQDLTPHDNQILMDDDPLKTTATEDFTLSYKTFNPTIDSDPNLTLINADQQTYHLRITQSTNPSNSASIEIIDVDTPTNASKLNDNDFTKNLNKAVIPVDDFVTVRDIFDTSNSEPKLGPLPPKQKKGVKMLKKLERVIIHTHKELSEGIGTHNTINTGDRRCIATSEKKSIVSTGDKRNINNTDVKISTVSTGDKKSNTRDKNSERFRVRLPPDTPPSQLVAMLNKKVAVRLEDVMRKKGVHKKTEITEI